MASLPQISEAEFEVMKIVWKYAPISTNEITERLAKTTSWSPKTIQTLIKRLVTKGALAYEKQSRVFVYTPLIQGCSRCATKRVCPSLWQLPPCSQAWSRMLCMGNSPGRLYT